MHMDRRNKSDTDIISSLRWSKAGCSLFLKHYSHKNSSFGNFFEMLVVILSNFHLQPSWSHYPLAENIQYVD